MVVLSSIVLTLIGAFFAVTGSIKARERRERMRDQHLKSTSPRRPGRLRPAAIRPLIASVALALIAVAWWVGLLGRNDAAVVGGFGTLFIIVAALCFVIAVHRQFRKTP